MIISEKKLKELELVLIRGNDLKVTESIKSLRKEIPFKGAISLLASFYDRSNDAGIRKMIKEFLNDLKDKSAREEVIDCIRKRNSAETRKMLISSCWQSGLDYSGYSAVFAHYFLEEDYSTAVECFSVIESSVNKISRSQKDELIKMIRQKSGNEVRDKHSLTLELISLLT
jgi:hypothetical protein